MAESVQHHVVSSRLRLSQGIGVFWDPQLSVVDVVLFLSNKETTHHSRLRVRECKSIGLTRGLPGYSARFICYVLEDFAPLGKTITRVCGHGALARVFDFLSFKMRLELLERKKSSRQALTTLLDGTLSSDNC